MFSLDNLLRQNIRQLVGYSTARSEFSGGDCTMLDANESCYCFAGCDGLNRYPDPQQLELKAAVSALKGVDATQLFLGNGSDEAIDLLIRAFCEPTRDSVLALTPSYGMYKVSAKINYVEMVEVLLNDDLSVNLERVLEQIKQSTKILFLCSPNNPTGRSIDIEQISALASSFEGLVVVDEAYIDFAEKPSCLSLLSEFPNLVVLQTFSKAWALAGIRLGMCFADSQIVTVLNKIKPPYNINTATIELALQVVGKVNEKDKFVAQTVRERERLLLELAKLPVVLKVYQSDANFLLVKVADAEKIYQHLLDRKLVVRRRDMEPLCNGCLRITVGTASENNSLLRELANVVGGN